MPQVMNGEDIGRALRRMAHEVIERHRGARDLLVVGIHTRGVHLARELASNIGLFESTAVEVGTLDIGLYRDDRDFRPAIEPKPTDIPVELGSRHVVIVDDVLFTGRTVRAALDALADIGRALTTELAVLIDRGHRELPIRADYVGKNLPTSREEVVKVRLAPVDGEDGVWVERVVEAA